MRIAVSRKLLDGRTQRVHCRSIADGVSHDIAGDARITPHPISYAPLAFAIARAIRASASVKGQTTAHVRIDIVNGVVVTSSITNEAVDDLSITEGDDVVAIIKASDVMEAK